MAQHTYIAGDTITKEWLNDTDALVYGSGNASRGSSLLQFLQAGTGAATRTVQTKLREVVSVADFSTLAQANTYVSGLANGGTLYFPDGAYSVTANTALSSNVAIRRSAGALITITAGSRLTINGPIEGPETQFFSGDLSSVTISRATNPSIKVAWFSGSPDVLSQINKAYAAITPGPCRLEVPTGQWNACTSTANLNDSVGIHIMGSGSADVNYPSNFGTQIQYSAGDSNSAITAQGSRAFELSRIRLGYNSPDYSGTLLSLRTNGHSSLTALASLHDFSIGGQAGAELASMLIELGHTLGCRMTNFSMDYGVIGIGCSETSNNNIEIGGGVWIEKHFSNTAIDGWGTCWSIGPLISESDITAGTPITTLFSLAGTMRSVRFNGVICLDGTGLADGKSLIDLTGQTSSGIDIGPGCSFSAGANTTAVRFGTSAGQTSAVHVHGAQFASLGSAFNMGKADSVSVVGCDFSDLTTPYNGTPTRLSWLSNNTPSTALLGDVAANGTIVDITPPGSALSGTGMVVVHVKSTTYDATGLFLLNGSNGSVTIVSDPSSKFDTDNTAVATKVSIYYDAGSSTYRYKNKLGENANISVQAIPGF